MNDLNLMQKFIDELNEINGITLSIDLMKNSRKSSESGGTILGLDTGVRSIMLIHPEIRSLPDQLPVFKKLSKLQIRGTKLETIPKYFFSKYDKIGKIYLNKNQFSELSSETFRGLAIDYLDISNNNLVSLPRGIFDFSDIANLIVESNKLGHLDESLFDELTMLNGLVLTGNGIVEISPLHFKSLENLEALLLSSNKINVLSADVFQYTTKLQRLTLDNNPDLIYLPDEIFQSTPTLSSLKLPEEANIPLSVGATQVQRLSHPQSDYDLEEYKQRWMSYVAPQRIFEILEQIEPEIPVTLSRIAEFSKITKLIAEKTIKKILQTQKDLGRYLDLEQVFIKQTLLKQATINEMSPSLQTSTISPRDSLQTCPSCGDSQSVMIRQCTNCKTDLPYCNICKRGFTDKDQIKICLHCKNKFHRTHLFAFVQAKGSCPVCKEKLTATDLEK